MTDRKYFISHLDKDCPVDIYDIPEQEQIIINKITATMDMLQIIKDDYGILLQLIMQSIILKKENKP